jgi:hypothetical protein
MAKKRSGEVHITTKFGRPLCQEPMGVIDHLTGGKGTLQCGYQTRLRAERALDTVGAMHRSNFIIVAGQCPEFANRREKENAEDARREAAAKEKLAEVFEDTDLLDEEAQT